MCDKDRQVANYPHVPCARVLAQRLPLVKENELPESLTLNLIAPVNARVVQGRLFSTRQGRVPICPGAIAVCLPQGAIERVIVEPPGIPFAKLLKFARELVTRVL